MHNHTATVAATLAVLAALVVQGACSVDDLPAVGRPCSDEAPCGPGTHCSPPPRTCVQGAAADSALNDAPADRGAGDAVLDAPADLYLQDLPPLDAGLDIPCPGPCPTGQDCVSGSCVCKPQGSCAGCCHLGTCVPLSSQSLAQCGALGAPCTGCDDALTCTADSCTTGACVNTPQAGTCAIENACFKDKAIKPNGPCYQCQAASSPNAWTPIPAVGCVTTLAGDGVPGYKDGPAGQARFVNITGLAVNAAGTTLLVADGGGHRIRALTLTGSRAVTTVAGSGLGAFKDGPALTAAFNGLTGLAVDSAGVIYVADGGNHRIRTITKAGRGGGYTVATLAGTGVVSMKDGPAASAGFNLPTGVAVTAAGTTLLVADTGNHRIRAVTKVAGTWTVSTIAGSGKIGIKDGLGSVATFNNPEGVTIVESGNSWVLRVADCYNHRVRRIKPQGSAYSVSTVAGWGPPGYQNGPGSSAKFNTPRGVAAGTSSGIFYVSDVVNQRLREIFDISTLISVKTVAGSGQTGFEDGAAVAARFTELRGLAVTDSMVLLTDVTRIRALILPP